MRFAVWRLEWSLHRARPRRLLWSVGIPLLLLAPVAASDAAAAHRSAIYVVFPVFFGVFGGAIPLIRGGERGWIERIALTGYGVRRWVLERAAAHAVQDLVQLAPALACVLWLEGTHEAVLLAGTAAGAFVALAAANLLGALVAGVVRSVAEGALVSATVGIVAVHLTGAFRPGAGAWATVADASPFQPLLLAARRVASSAEPGAVATAAGSGPEAAVWLSAAGALTGLAAGTWALAPTLVGRLTGRGRTL